MKTTAHNIANANTPGFTASRVEFTEGDAAAVNATLRDDGPVNLTEQLLKMIEYSMQFEAQTAIIREATNAADSVSDILSRRSTN